MILSQNPPPARKENHLGEEREACGMGSLHFEIGKKFTLTKTFAESDVYLFAGIIGDLFPAHVNEETVVLLSRKTPDDTIEVDLDLDELDIIAAESKATYQEIKDYVLKEFGLKVSTLYISQIKRKCGIDVGEHYNISQKENQKVPQCPKEKEDAIRAALEHFAMI